MSLLSLPSEIITAILDLLYPRGLENLTNTCRLLQARGERHLIVHRQMKEVYSRVLVGFPHTELRPRFNHPQYDGTSVQLLHQISQNPVIAHYIVAVCWTNDFFGQSAEDHALLEANKDFRTLVQEPYETFSMYLAMYQTSWLRAGSNAGLLTVLLSLLPNVVSLKIHHTSNDLETILEMVEQIAGYSDQRFRPRDIGEKSLQRLREVDMDWVEARVPETAFGLLVSFARLPSMRRLCGHAIRTSIRTFELPKCEVEDLELRTADLSTESLFQLLRPMTKLVRFHYHGWPNTWLHKCTPREMITFLEDFNSDTLEDLSLTSWQEDSGLAENTNIKSFRKFTKLKKLEVHTNFVASAGKRANRQNTRYRFSHVGQVPRFVDILPASLKVLRLDMETTIRVAVLALFDGFDEDMAIRLPVLQDICFTEVDPLIVMLCESVGVKVEIDPDLSKRKNKCHN